jgi:hypothetical protein
MARVGAGMIRVREPACLCQRCGALLTASVGADDSPPPEDGDYALCLSCAVFYIRADGGWQLAQPDDLLLMPAQLFCQALYMLRAISRRNRGRPAKPETLQ